MRYHFDLVCPNCRKVSEHNSDTRLNPRIKCGDCLMSYVEIVEMKIVSVRETGAPF